MMLIESESSYYLVNKPSFCHKVLNLFAYNTVTKMVPRKVVHSEINKMA